MKKGFVSHCMGQMEHERRYGWHSFNDIFYEGFSIGLRLDSRDWDWYYVLVWWLLSPDKFNYHVVYCLFDRLHQLSISMTSLNCAFISVRLCYCVHSIFGNLFAQNSEVRFCYRAKKYEINKWNVNKCLETRS